ncbi:MAG: type II toxin-antitoxin system MqsR family toxin [Thermodesulfobacteriota bacterium]|nr:type II toxin-antitoxin system MqsR family toxin [Thermodesulfobacteriota bacterium]
MVDLSQLKIAFFLKEFKQLVQEGGLYVVNRPEHQKSLVDLGLTKEACKVEILGLSVTDYCKGPQPDKDRPGDIWVFGKEFAGREVYIKLKIAQVESPKIAKCISFHAAKQPLCYPFKLSKRGR